MNRQSSSTGTLIMPAVEKGWQTCPTQPAVPAVRQQRRDAGRYSFRGQPRDSQTNEK